MPASVDVTLRDAGLLDVLPTDRRRSGIGLHDTPGHTSGQYGKLRLARSC
jgi:hypothetical protein